MTEEALRERIRSVVHGAVTNYVQAHGMTLASHSNVNSLEKRIVGGILGALKTGQLGTPGCEACETHGRVGEQREAAVPAGARQD